MISIHALLAESDSIPLCSKPPKLISIHALLAESDDCMEPGQAGPSISIHALLAESDGPRCKGPWACFRFLSTLSLRRATALKTIKALFDTISIHALLAESDAGPDRQRAGPGISIHALLAESDLVFTARQAAIGVFLSTLSLRRATASILHKILADWDFYPRSPCGERLLAYCTKF